MSHKIDPMPKILPPVLSIAGSDSSGGAGIQADLKTMAFHGVYAMTAITALTAQNTQGVRAILEASPEFLGAELDTIFEDIPPLAVKVGMVSSAPLIKCIADHLRKYQAKNIVVDPVMVATSGARLLHEDAMTSLQTALFPLACLLTPNLPEAELLIGRKLATTEEMEEAAQELAKTYGVPVLLKGGHLETKAADVLADGTKVRWYLGERIANPNTHGTGCTLSSAIAANLALGRDLEEAIAKAKAYVTGALTDQMNLGQGSGPLNHGYAFFPSQISSK